MFITKKRLRDLRTESFLIGVELERRETDAKLERATVESYNKGRADGIEQAKQAMASAVLKNKNLTGE